MKTMSGRKGERTIKTKLSDENIRELADDEVCNNLTCGRCPFALGANTDDCMLDIDHFKVYKAWIEEELIQRGILEPDYDECDGDKVNSPSHYTEDRIETIDFIRSKLTVEEFVGYCKGNVLKYVSRAGKKENTLASEDVSKAIVYLGWLEDVLKDREEINRG